MSLTLLFVHIHAGLGVDLVVSRYGGPPQGQVIPLGGDRYLLHPDDFALIKKLAQCCADDAGETP